MNSLPETKTTDSRATEAQVAEVMAFELAYWLHRHSSGHETVGMSDERFQDYWRDNPEYRDEARARTYIFLTAMEAAGLSARSSNSKRVLKRLQDLITVPARTAYALPGEESPFEQGVTEARMENGTTISAVPSDGGPLRGIGQ